MASVVEYCKQHFFGQPNAKTPMSNKHLDATTVYAKDKRYNYFDLNDTSTDGTTALVTPVESFNVNNPHHIGVLQDLTVLFKKKSEALMQLDKNIMTGLAFGVIGTSFSFLPFFGWIGLAGYVYAGSQAYHREKAYCEYHAALTELVGACNWSLGELNEQDANNLTNNPQIRQMMSALYRVLTEKNVTDLIDDGIEALFVAELTNYNSTVAVPGYEDDIKASKKGADFIRHIYGYGKGGWENLIDALVSLIPDAYHVACDSLERVQDWWHNSPEGATPTTLSTTC